MMLKEKLSKVVYKYGFLLTAVITLLMLLLNPADITSKSAYAMLIPVLIFIFFSLFYKVDFIQLFRECKWKKRIASFLVAILFMLCLPVIGIYNAVGDNLSFIRASSYLVQNICVFVFAWLDVLLLAYGSFGRSENKVYSERKWWGIYSVIVLFSVANIISCYPGLPHGDGWNIWKMARGFIPWTDWHPVGYLFFVRILQFIWYDTFIVVIAQTIIWLYVCFHALRILNKNVGLNACKVFLALSILNILSYSYLRVIYKDTIFAICLLGFTVFLYGYIKEARNTFYYINLVIFGVLASLFRHMMIVPIAITLAILLVIRTIKRTSRLRTTILLLATVILSVGIRQLIVCVYNAEENKQYVSYSVPIQMMAAYAKSGLIDDESKAFIERYAPAEKWSETFIDRFADPVARTGFLSEKQLEDMANHGKEIIEVNYRFFTRYPVEYLKYFLRQSDIIWQISESDDGWVWGVSGFDNSEKISQEEVPNQDTTQHFNLLTLLLQPIENLSDSLGVWRVFIFHGGIWNIILVICFMRSRQQKKDGTIVIITPIVVLEIILMLSIPAPDVRYILPITECSMFIVAAILTKKQVVKNNDSVSDD